MRLRARNGVRRGIERVARCVFCSSEFSSTFSSASRDAARRDDRRRVRRVVGSVERGGDGVRRRVRVFGSRQGGARQAVERVAPKRKVTERPARHGDAGAVRAVAARAHEGPGAEETARPTRRFRLRGFLQPSRRRPARRPRRDDASPRTRRPRLALRPPADRQACAKLRARALLDHPRAPNQRTRRRHRAGGDDGELLFFFFRLRARTHTHVARAPWPRSRSGAPRRGERNSLALGRDGRDGRDAAVFASSPIRETYGVSSSSVTSGEISARSSNCSASALLSRLRFSWRSPPLPARRRVRARRRRGVWSRTPPRRARRLPRRPRTRARGLRLRLGGLRRDAGLGPRLQDRPLQTRDGGLEVPGLAPIGLGVGAAAARVPRPPSPSPRGEARTRTRGASLPRRPRGSARTPGRARVRVRFRVRTFRAAFRIRAPPRYLPASRGSGTRAPEGTSAPPVPAWRRSPAPGSPPEPDARHHSTRRRTCRRCARRRAVARSPSAPPSLPRSPTPRRRARARLSRLRMPVRVRYAPRRGVAEGRRPRVRHHGAHGILLGAALGVERSAFGGVAPRAPPPSLRRRLRQFAAGLRGIRLARGPARKTHPPSAGAHLVRPSPRRGARRGRLLPRATHRARRAAPPRERSCVPPPPASPPPGGRTPLRVARAPPARRAPRRRSAWNSRVRVSRRARASSASRAHAFRSARRFSSAAANRSRSRAWSRSSSVRRALCACSACLQGARARARRSCVSASSRNDARSVSLAAR